VDGDRDPVRAEEKESAKRLLKGWKKISVTFGAGQANDFLK
jgi:hypothetical protein